jgi:hypothetical protein
VETVRKFLTVIARVIAAIFAFFFVITTLLAILLTTLNGQMFNARLYKNALVTQNIYSRLPEIVGAAITSNVLSNPCARNQLVCSMDGASPELQTCLTTALGTAAYQAIGSGARTPTSTELRLAQPCLDQYGKGINSQSGTGGSGMPSFLQNLTAADWQAMLTILLPPDTLKSMTESTLDQMFAYLNGEAASVSVPLVTLKQHLLGPSGANLILQLLNSQQPCSKEDLAQLTSGMSNGGIVFCKPPEDVLPLVTSLLPDLLNSVVPQIPDKAFIINPPAPGAPTPGSGPFGADPISTLRTIRLVMRLSLLIPLIFLILVTLFAVRNIKSWMRWWGIPFFVTGAITLVLGITIIPALNIAWIWFIAPQIPVFIPVEIPTVGLELFRSILKTLSGWIILPGVIICVLGLSAWIGSTFIKMKNLPEKQIATPAPTP